MKYGEVTVPKSLMLIQDSLEKADELMEGLIQMLNPDNITVADYHLHLRNRLKNRIDATIQQLQETRVIVDNVLM